MSRGLAFVLIAAIGVVLAGCNAEVSIGEKSIERADLESTISSGLGDQAGLPDPEVDCDGVQDIEVKDGSTFTCTGTAPNGDQFPIDVTLTDDQGGYRYEVPPTAGSSQGSGA